MTSVTARAQEARSEYTREAIILARSMLRAGLTERDWGAVARAYATLGGVPPACHAPAQEGAASGSEASATDTAWENGWEAALADAEAELRFRGEVVAADLLRALPKRSAPDALPSQPHEALRPLSDRERAIWRDGHQAGAIHANRMAAEERKR